MPATTYLQQGEMLPFLVFPVSICFCLESDMRLGQKKKKVMQVKNDIINKYITALNPGWGLAHQTDFSFATTN